jgi:hypothetical protein
MKLFPGGTIDAVMAEDDAEEACVTMTDVDAAPMPTPYALAGCDRRTSSTGTSATDILQSEK